MWHFFGRSRSSWYRISGLLAGWLGGPRSSGHTNSWWKNPPRPDGLSHGSHLPGWCAGNRLHRSKRSTNYTRGAGKTPEFFQFRFRTFLEEAQKKAPKANLMDFYEVMSLKSIRFYRWSSGVFQNVLKTRGVFPVFFHNQAYAPAMRKHWRPRNSTGGIFGVNRLLPTDVGSFD